MNNFFFLCLALCFFAFPSMASTMQVEETVDCKLMPSYDSDKIFDSEVVAYIDESGNFYIAPSAKIRGLPMRGYVRKNKYKDFVAALEKGQEWALKAKENKLETTKTLASFINKERVRSYGVTIVFLSKNEGEEILIGLEIVDFENRFSKGVILLTPDQLKEFIAIIKKLPETLDALKAEQKKVNDILK